jgi:pyruvate dehydrogenase E2 component (dihydrolipoamide acetyltransferase)
MYPVDEFTAIINPPQAGILALGRIRNILHVSEDGAMTIRSVCTCTGSFDHRIVSGAQAALLFSDLQSILDGFED